MDLESSDLSPVGLNVFEKQVVDVARRNKVEDHRPEVPRRPQLVEVRLGVDHIERFVRDVDKERVVGLKLDARAIQNKLVFATIQ